MQTWRDTSAAHIGSNRAYAGAIGSSPAWQGVLAAAVRVATTEATVLLQGESGTGKEGELTLTAQVKLLRFLQEREYQRLGGTRLQKADVHIIAASNQDLGDAVARGAFREDLLYRLQVFDILLPPLRERVSDISLLAQQFLADFAHSMGRRLPRLRDDALEALLAHDWPGNVRELHNVLERAIILADGDIERHHVSLRPKTRARSAPSDRGSLERRTIERVLNETAWNKAEAARRLGLTRTQLYGRLRRHGLEAARTDCVLA